MPRQNIRDQLFNNTDAENSWRLTTGVSSPTYVTPTKTQRGIIDNDANLSTFITTDGVRVVLPEDGTIQRIDVTFTVSTLASAPTIEVFLSTDVRVATITDNSPPPHGLK